MTEYSPRINTLLETGQISYDDAERISGRNPDTRSVGVAAIKSVQQPGAKKAPRRYSRRGGRSFPEPSDSDLDPYWNTGTGKIDDAQIETNRKGIELVRAAGDFAKSPQYLALPIDERDAAIEQFVASYQAAQYRTGQEIDT